MSDNLEGELVHGVYLAPPGLPLRLLPLLLKLLRRQLFSLKCLCLFYEVYFLEIHLFEFVGTSVYLQPHYGCDFVCSSHDYMGK